MCSRSRPMTVQPKPFGSPPASGSSKKRHDRVHAHSLEEIVRAFARAIRPPRRLCIRIVEGVQNFVLLFGSRARKFLDCRKHLVGARLKLRQPFAIVLLVIDRKRRQRAIDEIHHASFTRSRRVGRGNNPRADRVDLRRLRRSEKTQLRGFGCLYSLAGVRSGGEQRGPIRGNPDSGEATTRTQ